MADVSIVSDDNRLKTSSEGKSVKRAKTSHAQSSPVHSHPTYDDMVKRSIAELKQSKGSSRAAILKYIVQNFQVGSNFKMINAHLRMALKRGVILGTLWQIKGVGASGSFKLPITKAKTEMKKVIKTKVVQVPKPKIAPKGTKKLKVNEVAKTVKSVKTKKAKIAKVVPKKVKKSIPAAKTGGVKLKKAAPKKKAV